MKYVSLGIDLGTTNSAICFAYTDRRVKTQLIDVPNSKSGGILPSCVKYLSRDEVEVGVSAYDTRWQPSVAYSMKRHMTEGASYKKHIIAENGEEFDVTPIEVGSKVLKHLIDYAEDVLGIDNVNVKAKYTITVPAYFNEVARFNTVEAAKMAGIDEEMLALINEPTAAALSYGITARSRREKILVYDLGGGTFDVAMLTIERGRDNKPTFTVTNCDGDDNLGGDDLDNEIAKFCTKLICEKISNEFGVEIEPEQLEDSKGYRKIVLNCEKIKKLGQGVATVKFDINTLGLNPEISNEIIAKNGSEVIGLNVSFDLVKEISDRILVEPTTRIIDNLLMKEDTSRLSSMVMIGGSTKGDELIESIEERYPDLVINNTADPDRSVAIGASIYTEMILNDEANRLSDVIQLPIGVLSLIDGKQGLDRVISQNSKIPVSATRNYSTLSRDQDGLDIQVYQGKSPYVEDCIQLGTLKVKGLQEVAKRKEEYLEGDSIPFSIKLNVNVSGILTATVTCFDETWVGEISRLASGVKEEKQQPKSKEAFIKKRQINLIKQMVSEEELDSVLEQYEEEFAKGMKNASKFISDLRNKGKFETTNLF